MDHNNYQVLKLEPYLDECQTVETVFPSSSGYNPPDKIHRSSKIYSESTDSKPEPRKTLPIIEDKEESIEPIEPKKNENHLSKIVSDTVETRFTDITDKTISKQNDSMVPIEKDGSKQTGNLSKKDDSVVSKQNDNSVTNGKKTIKVIRSQGISISTTRIFTIDNPTGLNEASNLAKSGDHFIFAPGIYPLLIIKGGVSYFGQGQVVIQNISTLGSKEQAKIFNLSFNISKSPINCLLPISFDKCKFNFVGSPNVNNLTGLQIQEGSDFSGCNFYFDYQIPQSTLSCIFVNNGNVLCLNSVFNINNGVKSIGEVFKLNNKKANLTAIGNIVNINDKGAAKFTFVNRGSEGIGSCFVLSNVITGNNDDSKNKSTISISNTQINENSNIMKMTPESNWNYVKISQYNSKVRIVKSDCQLSPDDRVVFIAESSPRKITLPLSQGTPDNNASFNGQNLTIKGMINGVNHQIIAPKGNLINGQSSLVVGHTPITCQSWGPNWFGY